jgi:hypothetical protein
MVSDRSIPSRLNQAKKVRITERVHMGALNEIEKLIWVVAAGSIPDERVIDSRNLDEHTPIIPKQSLQVQQLGPGIKHVLQHVI